MAMVNTMINPLQVKDSRWLTLEVCREFQRNKCTRAETECKFAHPPPHVEVQNGRVTCCFDSIKGKCQRKDPPCKYLHPPQHLKEQLLQNGRNNLILKNLQMQALAASAGLQPMVPGMIPTVMYEPGSSKPAPYPTAVLPGQYPVVAHPYMAMSQNTFNPYLSPAVPTMGGMVATMDASANAAAVSGAAQQVPGVVPTAGVAAAAQQKVPRADRLEGMSAVPGMVPTVKRTAIADNKSGMIPVYQHGTGTTTYQQAALAAMQLQQQPFVPVTIAGHPPSMPRF